MVQRDQAPGGYLGFGVTENQLPIRNEREAGNPEAGAVERYFENRPIQKFFATATATIVGASVSGAMVRRGGKRMLSEVAARAAARPGSNYENVLQTHKKTRQLFDELEGLARTTGNTRTRMVDGEEVTFIDPSLDTAERKFGFMFTHEEKLRMERLGGAPPAEWLLRDELQQRLVSQARRLPYELPAIYVTQRALFDPITGDGPEEGTNLLNPVDLIGDFAQQTAKNLAFAFLPFEGAVGASSHGWRKALTTGANANYTGMQKVGRDAVIDVHDSLKLLGIRASDLLNDTIRISNRTTGAMAAAITDTAAKTKSLAGQTHAMRHGSGGVRGWMERVSSGEEIFGMPSQVANMARVFRHEFRDLGQSPAQASVRAGEDTVFGRFAASVSGLRGKTDDLTEGTLFKELADSHYKRTVQRHLVDSGLDEKVASRFVKDTQFTLPTSQQGNISIDRRVQIGKRSLTYGDEGLMEAFRQRAEHAFTGHGKTIADNIEEVIRRSDSTFMAGEGTLRREARNTWNKAYRDVFGKGARESMGVRQAAYRDFAGDMGEDANEYLVRRSAERLGIGLHTSSGARRSTSSLKTDISRRGFDPSNKGQLKAFLINKGDISKPWNLDAFSPLGLRPMSVQEAMDDGVFQENRHGKTIDNLSRVIKEADMDENILNRLRVGGMYKDTRGGTFDITPLQRGARGFMDKLANEVKIPLIQVKPLQLFGYQTNYQSTVQFSAASRQPFVPGSDEAVGTFWMANQRKAKGRLAQITRGDDGLESKFLEGVYKPYLTNARTLRGRSVRLAHGDAGYRKEQSEWERRLDADPDAANSLIGTIGRFMRRKDDFTNPARLARGVVDNDLPTNNPGAVFRGFENLLTQWRNSGFAPGLVRAIDEDVAPGLYNLFGGADSVFNMDPTNLLSAARRELDTPLPSGVSTASARTYRNTREALLRKWDEVENIQQLDRPITASARHSGMAREADQLRMDLIRTRAAREAVEGGPGAANNRITDYMRELNDIYKTGAIDDSVRAEARQALGSIYAANLKSSTLQGNVTRQEQMLDVLSKMQRSIPGIRTEDSIRQIFEDSANYGTSGVMTRRMKQKFGAAPHEFSGADINPLGDVTYVPTLGTAFARDPLGTVGSVLGVNTWSRPEAFSGASIPISHIYERMNKALGVAGLSVKSDNYSGPLEMFAKGMVGKRMAPIYAGGATLMAIDRTAGAIVSGEEDAYGNNVYTPLITGGIATGFAEAQILAAGIPGGQTMAEKREEIYEGETAVRRGRWWMLGSTPWEGGKVEYYRPSWYRRFMSGYQYTDQNFGSPMERLAFGYDFSPLRPLNPNWWEKKHAEDRPYPVSGEYFTGPWGPLTPALNMTIGRVLKPRQMMNEDALAAGMSSYVPYGDFGMASTGELAAASGITTLGQYQASAGRPAYSSGSVLANENMTNLVAPYLASLGRPNMVATEQRTSEASMLSASMTQPGFVGKPLDVLANTNPASARGIGQQSAELAYRTQEFAGIYGFAFGGLRDKLGLGGMDYDTHKPVLASADIGYGTSRQFWDLNLGGLGDFPTPLEGEYANLELSEVVRRFIPRPRTSDMINPIPNLMGVEHQWLPGDGALTNFKIGDPYVAGGLKEGEMRLPGAAYERFNTLQSDETGRYGRMDRLKILGDVAPYSDEYRAALAEARGSASPEQQMQIAQIEERVEIKKRKYDFKPYEYKYSSPSEMDKNPLAYAAGRAIESAMHSDNFLAAKFINNYTAVEHWERNEVYGSSFPEWQSPIKDFIQPMLNRAGDQNPLRAFGGMAAIGSLFGASKEAKLVGSLVGGVSGAASSIFRDAQEAVTGERFMPAERRRELAVEEYADILSYTRAVRGFNMAEEQGDQQLAGEFKRQMKSTMYGADIYGGDFEQLAMTVPKRKREHFRAMIQAPEEERERILSTAGRLERRIYQAAWGMEVERRPDLVEYYEDHELPGEDWQGWDLNTDMEHVKLKVMQQEGLRPSQMGYYPQQVREANLVNPSYPSFSMGTQNPAAQLEQLLRGRGMMSNVRQIPTPYPGARVQLSAGVA